MKNDINLLPQKKGRSSRDTRQTRLLRLISVGLLLLVATVSSGIFIVTAFSPLPKLREEEATASKEMDNLRAKSSKYVLANTRLTEIGTYLDNRLKYPEVLSDIQSTEQEDILFTGIDLFDRDVTLNITSPSLLSINTLINSFRDKSEKERLYTNFSLTGLTYSATDSLYRIGLNVTIR